MRSESKFAFYIADVKNGRCGVYEADTLPDAVAMMLEDYEALIDYEDNASFEFFVDGFKFNLDDGEIVKINNVECHFMPNDSGEYDYRVFA